MKTRRKLVKNRPIMLKYRDENFSNYIKGLTVPPDHIKYTIFGSLCVKTVKI